MAQMELAVIDFILELCRNPFMDSLMPAVTSLGDAGFLWILLGLALLCSRKYRRTGAAVLLSLAADLVICNLLLKKRNYRAIASKYITKSYGYEFCIRYSIIILNYHLTYTFCRTHYISRINGFICTYHYKSLGIIFVCHSCKIPGTSYIILNCLIRASLHKRNVLMCRCVIYNIRSVM